MSRRKGYPVPKPICPFCGSTDIEIRDIETTTMTKEELVSKTQNSFLATLNFTSVSIPSFYKFRCENCKITSQYEYDSLSEEYLYMIRVEGNRKRQGVTYSEWCKWAASYYTHKRFLVEGENSKFGIRYKILKNKEFIEKQNNDENVT